MITWGTLVSAKHTGDELRFNCNHCDDQRGRLYINRKNGKYHCFNCGIGGRCAPDIMTLVTGQQGYEKKFESDPACITLGLDINWSGRRYLQLKRININLARKWGVRSVIGDYHGRIGFSANYWTNRGSYETSYKVPMTLSAHAVRPGILPKSIIETEDGRTFPMILAATGLRFDDESQPVPIYLDKKTGRYVLASTCSIETAILVEGPSDAYRIFSALRTMGCSEIAVVCLWGKNLKEEHAFHLGKMFSRVQIFLDRDVQAEAHEMSRRLEIFGDHVEVFNWDPMENMEIADPADMPDGLMQRHLEEFLR